MGRPKTIETDALLKIAREVFLESGALGSTREIARRAGVSEPALFKRFPTKSALFLAALAPPKADIAEMFAAPRSEKDPRRALHLLARNMLAYYRMALPRMLPLITHPAIGLEELRRQIDGLGTGHLDSELTQYLREQDNAGRLSAPNPRASAGILVAMLHSVVLFEVMGVHGGAVPDAALAAMIDALWNGFSPNLVRQTKRRRKA